MSQDEIKLPHGILRCAVAASDVYLLVDPRFDARSARIEAGEHHFPFTDCPIEPWTVFRDNLIPGADLAGDIPLSLPPNVLARIGKDILPEWTLAGGHTAFIEVADKQQTPFDALVEFGPGNGNAISLEPGVPYVLEALVAAHRLKGQVVVTVTDPSGNAQSQTVEFDEAHRGGRQDSEYNRVAVQIPVSSVPRRARIGFRFIKESNPVPGSPGFMFVANLLLGRGKLSTHLGARYLVGPYSPPAGRLLKCSPNPYAIKDGNHDLVLRSGTTDVTLLSFHSVDIHIAQTQGNRLELSAAQAGLYAYYRDGAFVSNIGLDPEAIAMPLAAADLDGGIHHVSIRDRYGVFVHGEDFLQFPSSLTPYDILQREITPPIPSYLAPNARFRYLALQAHIARSAAVPAYGLSNVLAAHQVLERGFDNLVRYPKISLDSPKKPEISVIIPVHNKLNVTFYCLCALVLAANKASFEVIIVDDGSTDGTRDLASMVEGIRIIRNDTSEGFVSACNRGADAAKGQFLVFLNNDTEPTVGWLDELVAVYNSFPSVGLVGSKLLYPNGRLQEAGGIVWRSGNPWNYGRGGNPWDPRYCYVRQVDYVSGAALMVPNKVWKEVGGFSEEFRPAYFEDTDLAFKIRAAGYRTYFAPHSIVYHFEGVSSGTDISAGFKQYQEVNRPTFKKKWSAAFRQFGEEGINPDLEKDRGITGRVAFIDYTTPRPDFDAGSYAAIQEMKLVQALGFKVTFVAQNVAHLGHYTEDLERMGIEVICAPFALSLSELVEKRGGEFSAFYVTRYDVAKRSIPLIRKFAPHAKIIFNIADLHFLRELRAGISARNPKLISNAVKIREEELAVLLKVDIALSYSYVEHAVILSHNLDATKVHTCPWVVEVAKRTPTFAERKGIAFIGNYAHPPNVEAVEFFVQQVMPLLRKKLPKVSFHVYGSKVPASLTLLAGDDVIIEGYAEDLNDVFGTHRIFVAPLLSGAGIKGKVLSAMSYGAPSVLSPLAAEGIALVPGTHCAIAKTPADWVDSIVRLYQDENAWNAMSAAAKELMEQSYSFANGVELMREAFHAANLY